MDWIKIGYTHHNAYPHFDLFGKKQKEILQQEQLDDHIERFKL